MKNLLTYILLFSAFVSCNTSDNSSLNKQKLEDSVTIELPKVQGDFAIYEYDLRMYNVPYLLRIIPSIDTTQNTYQTNIVLTQKGDTIFNKLINADSLFNSIVSYKDKPKYLDYLNKNELYKSLDTFKLEKVLYSSVRTDDLFFTSLFRSKSGDELYVNFQITYLGKAIKKLFVNGVYEERKYFRYQGINNTTRRKIWAEQGKLFTVKEIDKSVMTFPDSEIFCDAHLRLTFPIFKLQNKKVSEFLNDTISKLLITDFLDKSLDSMLNCKCEIDTLSSPSYLDYFHTEYFLTIFNDSIISLVLNQEVHAEHGGNGFSNTSDALFYSYKHGKILKLKDVLIPDSDSIITPKIEQIEDGIAVSPYNPDTDFERLLESTFYVNENALIFFYRVYMGGGSYDNQVLIRFNENKKYFKKDFLELIGK